MSAGATVDAAFFGLQFLAVAESLRTRDPWFTGWCRRLTALCLAIGLAFSLTFGYWLGAGFCLVTLALLLGDWRKRDGRRVAKVVGERGQAVIAGLLEKVRDAGSPVPEGARA